MADQTSEDQKKVKSTKEQRNFGCPCGKTYLSYPALFTHVKQKHGGKPPGVLIKPKSQKARGRPRINSISNQSEGEDSPFNIQQELSRVLSEVKVPHLHSFMPSYGRKSCNDMMSSFMNSYELLQEQKRSLQCFIVYVKTIVDEKYDEGYWDNQPPTDIIDVSNQMVRALPEYNEKFPFDRKSLVDLVFILFKWMYKNKWTDHKLVRRSNSSETTA